MDDRNESSSGMMIAVIAGGIVLLLLILAGVGGVAWLFMADMRVAHHDVAFDEVAPQVAEVQIEMAPQGAAPVQVAEKNPVAKDRERFLGVWEATDPKFSATLHFKADGTILLTKPFPGDAAVVGPATCRWEVLESKGDRVKLRRVSEDKNLDVEHDIDFQGKNHFTVRGPFPQNDGWILKGGDGTAAYQRTKN